MSIKIGSTDISAVCDKIYVGSDEVYSSAPTKWTWNDFKNFINTSQATANTNLNNAKTWFLNNINRIENDMNAWNFNPNIYNNFLLVYQNPFYQIEFFNIDTDVFYRCNNSSTISFRKGSSSYNQTGEIYGYRSSTGSYNTTMVTGTIGGIATGLMAQKPENNNYGNVVIETL